MKNIKFFYILFFLFLIITPPFLLSRDVEFPLIQSFSYFPFSDDIILEKNQFSLSLKIHYSNIFMFDYEKTSINDMELVAGTIGFRYGLRNSITLELYLRLSYAYGGIMDNFIEKFHNFFGLYKGGREEYEKNKVHYYLKDCFLYSNRSANFLPLIIGIEGKIFENKNFSFKERIALGIPFLSKPGFSNNSPFLISGLIVEYKNRNLLINLFEYISFFQKPEWLKNWDIRNFIFLSEIKLHYKRMYLGCILKTSPFKYGDISNRALQLYFGYRLSEKIEFSIAEEIPPSDTVPDMSFNIRINLFERKKRK
ncbi:DUF3187 family protein [Candidatus Aminicenantes bacterium AH-873-B07]|nr:DUF3187 family protein [Candidatus Aminicenantes bacterium AH-873-B07]